MVTMASPIKQPKRNTGFKVKVAVRVRPNSNGPSSLEVLGSQITARAKQVRTFAFDRCFDELTSQNTLYELFGNDMVQHALDGYNACIFAYGQTGSGKTHTMLGSDNQPGLIPQICDRLFEYIHEMQNTTAVTIRISFMEIYNEQVRDLLRPPSQQSTNTNTTTSQQSLRVRGTGGDDCYVEGLSEYKVMSPAEVVAHLQRGAQNRSTAATSMNDTSSRSHAVVSLTIKQQSVIPQSEADKSTEEKISVLRLVDLAGSERAGSTGATGERLREGSNINKSLVTLGRVISALADLQTGSSIAGNTVVPYRESILTRLLQNSLGGNSRTAMIACVSPDAAHIDQTMSTLRYADQAKRITTRARVNKDTITNATHEARLATMQKELNELRQQLISQPLHEDSKLANLVQFYEDEAARERVRCKMLEMEKEKAERHSLELADYVREISGRGISSIDVSSNLNFETLMADQKKLEDDVRSERICMQEKVQKWRQIVLFAK